MVAHVSSFQFCYGCICFLCLSSAIPIQLLAKIDHTLSLAQRHNLSTITSTEVFGHLQLAFQYGRLISADLHSSVLEKYDRAFTSYLRTLVEGEEEKVREDLKKCKRFSGNLT